MSYPFHLEGPAILSVEKFRLRIHQCRQFLQQIFTVLPIFPQDQEDLPGLFLPLRNFCREASARSEPFQCHLHLASQHRRLGHFRPWWYVTDPSTWSSVCVIFHVRFAQKNFTHLKVWLHYFCASIVSIHFLLALFGHPFSFVFINFF